MARDLEPLKTVVHPVTGEQVELAGHPAGDLLHIHELLKDRAAQLRDMADAVERELIMRGSEPGMYDIDQARSRQWDVVDLEATLHDLVMRGRLTLRDTAGIIRQGEKTVDGRKALALLNGAEEDVLLDLRRCFTWKQGRSQVTPVHAEIER